MGRDVALVGIYMSDVNYRWDNNRRWMTSARDAGVVVE